MVVRQRTLGVHSIPLWDVLKRRLQIVAYAQRHPMVPLDDIGKEFGLTRARIHQILSEYLPEWQAGKQAVHAQERVCPQCGGTKARDGVVCRTCRSANVRTTVKCSICGAPITRYKNSLRTHLKGKFFYCGDGTGLNGANRKQCLNPPPTITVSCGDCGVAFEVPNTTQSRSNLRTGKCLRYCRTCSVAHQQAGRRAALLARKAGAIINLAADSGLV